MERERAVELIQAEINKQRSRAQLHGLLGEDRMAEDRRSVANALEIALEALGAKGDELT